MSKVCAITSKVTATRLLPGSYLHTLTSMILASIAFQTTRQLHTYIYDIVPPSSTIHTDIHTLLIYTKLPNYLTYLPGTNQLKIPAILSCKPRLSHSTGRNLFYVHGSIKFRLIFTSIFMYIHICMCLPEVTYSYIDICRYWQYINSSAAQPFVWISRQPSFVLHLFVYKSSCPPTVTCQLCANPPRKLIRR